MQVTWLSLASSFELLTRNNHATSEVIGRSEVLICILVSGYKLNLLKTFWASIAGRQLGVSKREFRDVSRLCLFLVRVSFASMLYIKCNFILEQLDGTRCCRILRVNIEHRETEVPMPDTRPF